VLLIILQFVTILCPGSKVDLYRITGFYFTKLQVKLKGSQVNIFQSYKNEFSR